MSRQGVSRENPVQSEGQQQTEGRGGFRIELPDSEVLAISEQEKLYNSIKNEISTNWKVRILWMDKFHFELQDSHLILVKFLKRSYKILWIFGLIMILNISIIASTTPLYN